jgi:AraC-like DNA-binding protein
MSMTVAINAFSDFEALQGIMPDGHSDVVQIGRGKMSGSLTHMEVDPSFGMSSGTFSRGVRLLGVTSPRRFMLGMVLATDGEATAWQREIGGGDFLMVAPGVERYSVYQDATKFSAALVAPEELDAFLANEPGARDAAAQLQSSVMQAADEATTADNVRNLTSLITTLAEQGPSMPAGTVEFYKRNILELVTAPIRDLVRYRGRQLRSYAQLVRDADRYLIEAGNRPVHVSELCDVFNVSRRALHRAFMSVLGIPPIAFARRKRLCDVHEALSDRERDATVKLIAIEHGFADLSRFATAYRRLFGELPSQTLRRRGPTPMIWLVCFSVRPLASLIALWLLLRRV